MTDLEKTEFAAKEQDVSTPKKKDWAKEPPEILPPPTDPIPAASKPLKEWRGEYSQDVGWEAEMLDICIQTAWKIAGGPAQAMENPMIIPSIYNMGLAMYNNTRAGGIESLEKHIEKLSG